MLHKHIVIGDVHGCLDELELLIQQLALQPTDIVYFIGDLIDKGPNSLGVVQYVYQLSLQHNVILILGNHEEKFLRFLDHKAKNSKSLETMKIPLDFYMLEQNLTTHEINFLKQSYYTFIIPELSILLVHGGIPKNTILNFSVNLRYQTTAKKAQLQLLTMTRYLDSNGNFMSLGSENDFTTFWADSYDGKYGKVVFGHHSFIQDKPKEFPYALGIDNGCVYGGFLTAFVFTENEMNSISVKALTIYSENYDSKK